MAYAMKGKSPAKGTGFDKGGKGTLLSGKGKDIKFKGTPLAGGKGAAQAATPGAKGKVAGSAALLAAAGKGKGTGLTGVTILAGKGSAKGGTLVGSTLGKGKGVTVKGGSVPPSTLAPGLSRSVKAPPAKPAVKMMPGTVKMPSPMGPMGTRAVKTVVPPAGSVGVKVPPMVSPVTMPSEPVDLPFAQPVRRIVEQRLRCPHRNHPASLLRVRAHWTDLPADLPCLDGYVKAEQDTETALYQDPVPVEGVDCRALLVMGINPEKAKGHITRRVEVVASNVLKGPALPPEGEKVAPHLEAYGGVVNGRTDAELKKGLAAKLAELNGMSFSAGELSKFVEFEYRGGRRCVFFLVQRLGDGEIVKLRHQSEEIEEEVEEEVMVTDDEAEAVAKKKAEEEAAERALKQDDEDGDVNDPPPRKKCTKKVKQMKTKIKKVKTVQPMKLQLANLLEYKTSDKMYIETVELAMAADALDECIRRQMAGRLWGFLQERVEEQKTVKEEDEQRQQEKEGRKRKRDEEAEERKIRRDEKEAGIKKQWKAEDAGKTDDEKKADMPVRAKMLQDLWKDEDEQLKNELLEEAKRERSNIVVGDDGQEYQLTTAAVPAALDAFQYFDRIRTGGGLGRGKEAAEKPGISGTGRIKRERLQDALLCHDDDLAPGEVEGVLAGAGAQGTVLQYAPLCTKRQRVPVPRKEEKEEKGDAADAAAAPAGGN